MSIVLGLWHLVVEGGKDQTIQTPACVQITNISYGEEIVDTNSRDIVKLSFESLGDDEDDDEEEEEEDNEDKDSNDGLRIDTTVLCALTPGKIEHALVNITLDSDAMYKFEVVGKNTVYLTGNYIRQDEDEDVSGSEDEFGSEDGYDLREVSSDVEIHADDLDELESNNSRFEEVVDTPEPAKGKRARESDVSEAPVKAEKKNKKQKAESGKAVEVPAEEKKDKKKEKKEKESKAAAEKPEPKAKRTIAGGVVIQDAKIGSGPVAKAGNTVRMRYVGKLTNGKEFDKNVSGKPFVFRLGKGEVIKGWDEGIAGMQVGGERVLTIPPAMAYGSKKTGSIPANSTLIFEVKLLEIK